MHTRPHWSYSSISQYLACPLRYYFQRILCLPQPTVGSGLVLGSAVHAALAHYHHDLQLNRKPRRDAIRTTFVESWDRRDGTTIAFKEGETRADLMAQGMALVELYLAEPPPERIVAVEQEIISPVHDSTGEYLETPLVAIADLIVDCGSGLLVREFKTSARAYGESEVSSSLQPTCYVNAVQEVFGEPTTVEYTVLIKTKTPKIQKLPVERQQADLGRLGDIVKNIEKGVQAGIFYPVESAMNCSTCPYRGPCREWGRPKLPHEDSTALVPLEVG
jgi:CRISPR/Cas system-associated exonuclease Cas4 (RecB family)